MANILKNKTEKEKAEIYYSCLAIASELKQALENTRKQEGISIKDIANCVKKVLSGAEIQSLKKEL